MKIKSLTLLLLCLCLGTTALQASIYEKPKQLYTVHTDHFDIIFPSECAPSALLLAKDGDRIYEKIEQETGLYRNLHFPLVLTADTQQLNAYFTSAYTPRIVLYDTPATGSDLDVFSQPLLSTFKHELTHAISLTSDDLISLLTNHTFSIYDINATPALMEGISVSEESWEGEGRVNDPFFNQLLLQSKLEGKLPGWHDIQGAADRPYTISTDYYTWGGAFTYYLRTTYGQQAYATYWNSLGRFYLWVPFLPGPFEKAYGMSIGKAWDNFLATIPTVAVDDTIPATDIAKGRYYSLAMYDGSPCTIDASKEALVSISDKRKTKKLLGDIERYEQLTYADGKVVSNGYVPDQMAKTRFVTLSAEGSSFHRTDGFRLAVPFHKGYAGLGNKGSTTWLSFRDSDGKEYRQARLCKGEQVRCIGVWDDKLVLLSHLADGRRLVSYLDAEGNRKGWYLPADLVISQFSIDSGKLYMSYGVNGNLPRLCWFDLSDGTLTLMLHNISGGVCNPVGTGDKVYFLRKMTDGSILSSMDLSAVGPTEQRHLQLQDIAVEPAGTSAMDELKEDYEVCNYNPLPYLAKGLLLPSMQSSDGILQIGLDFTSLEPTETVSMELSGMAALDADDASLRGFTQKIAFGGQTGNRSWNTSYTYKQLDEKKTHTLDFSFCLPRYFNTNSVLALFPSVTSKITETEGVTSGTVTFDSQLEYIHRHHDGLGAFAYRGYTVFGEISTRQDAFDLSDNQNYGIAGGLSLRFPRLLPFDSTEFTYNLPVSLGAREYYTVEKGWWNSLSVSTVLFSKEIQKPFCTPVFVRRFHIDAMARFYSKQVDLSDYYAEAFPDSTFADRLLDIEAMFDIAPNVTALTGSGLSVGLGICWYWNDGVPADEPAVYLSSGLISL
ncbi:MAG: hypothetical protein LKE40_01535 [Spirochaetia bacterium]|jgi:hypothetical protein|nr:hypothetical protein [Spirochaetia bacterium]